MIKFGMRSPKIRRYAVIIAVVLMLASVVVLADVIYYYKGVITAQVTTPPLVFYSEGFPYTLNSYFSGYANFTALSTGFTATINITNAYYAYFYHALGLVVRTPGWLYVTNVTQILHYTDIINKLVIVVQNANTGQTVCSLPAIINAQPITSPTQACSLNPGYYFISVLVQPNTPLCTYCGQSETVTLYFGYNVASQASVPLPPT